LADREELVHVALLLRDKEAVGVDEERLLFLHLLRAEQSSVAPPLLLRVVLPLRPNPAHPSHLLQIPRTRTRTSSTFPVQVSATSLQPPPPKSAGIGVPTAALLLPSQDPAAPGSSC
jgi:hypothetical protein